MVQQFVADSVGAGNPWGFLDDWDAAVFEFLGRFARRSWTLDSFIHLLHFNSLVRGAPLVALFWWAWYQERRHTPKREILLTGVLACFLAILAARTVSWILPFRERPLRNPALPFRMPYGVGPDTLLGWSAFPSDTAAFFVALATTLLLYSPSVGLFAFGWVVVTTLVPRVYFGIHHPSDMGAGALIGAGVVLLATRPALRRRIAPPLMAWEQRNPATFYAALFLVSCQATEAFGPFLDAVHFVVVTAQAAVARL